MKSLLLKVVLLVKLVSENRVQYAQSAKLKLCLFPTFASYNITRSFLHKKLSSGCSGLKKIQKYLYYLKLDQLYCYRVEK